MERPRKRTAAHAAAVLALALLSAACSGGSARVVVNEGGEAAGRLAAAIDRIAATLGKPASEIESKLKTKLPNASIDDLALQAERTADETATFERLAAEAAAAQEAERNKTFNAIHDATCDLIDLIEDTSDDRTDDEKRQAFREAIIERMRGQDLDVTEEKVTAIWKAVVQQYDHLDEGGSVDPNEIAIDLACL